MLFPISLDDSKLRLPQNIAIDVPKIADEIADVSNNHHQSDDFYEESQIDEQRYLILVRFLLFSNSWVIDYSLS